MRSGGRGARHGRTTGEIARAAVRVRARGALQKYRRLCLLGGRPKRYSHSLENGVFYDVSVEADRAAFLDLYSDGRSAACIVAITATQGKIGDEEAIRAATYCIDLGFVPLFGMWDSAAGPCEDVAIAIDHGAPVESVASWAWGMGQEAILVVTHEGYRLIFNPELNAGA